MLCPTPIKDRVGMGRGVGSRNRGGVGGPSSYTFLIENSGEW